MHYLVLGGCTYICTYVVYISCLFADSAAYRTRTIKCMLKDEGRAGRIVDYLKPDM